MLWVWFIFLLMVKSLIIYVLFLSMLWVTLIQRVHFSLMLLLMLLLLIPVVVEVLVKIVATTIMMTDIKKRIDFEPRIPWCKVKRSKLCRFWKNCKGRWNHSDSLPTIIGPGCFDLLFIEVWLKWIFLSNIQISNRYQNKEFQIFKYPTWPPHGGLPKAQWLGESQALSAFQTFS